MQLAIHHYDSSKHFSMRWINYCNQRNIKYKIVNCYSTNLIDDIKDCHALLWHFSHAHPIDFQIAICIIASLNAKGFPTFPNIQACWHFDNKVAQRYLLEATDAPLIKSWVFFSKQQAFDWIDRAKFPLVFKLKSGSSSANVKLVNTRREAKHLARISFSRGFRQFDRRALFRFAMEKYLSGNIRFSELGKTFLKLFKKSQYEILKGNERGYVYFQEYLPNNSHDTRIVIIGNRAFGLKRYNRRNDFRASGSGLIEYSRDQIDERCVAIAFKVSQKLKANCLAFDFLLSDKNIPLIAEISYGFVPEPYDLCQGYWDHNLTWHDDSIAPQQWMIDDLIDQIHDRQS